MAHPDLNTLLNTLLPFAELMLSENGEFYPFGAKMSLDGEVVNVGAKIEGEEHPPSQSLIELMTQNFQRQTDEGRLLAAGICYDVRTTLPDENRPSDAVCCSLEHLSGDAVDVYVPYERDLDGKVQYGQIFATLRTPTFFSFAEHG
jgi:hypothetical protein